MSDELREINVNEEADEVLRELHEHYVAWEAEMLPDDPPTTFEQHLSQWRNVPDYYIRRRWMLRENGGIAAVALVSMKRHEDLDNGFALIHVRPSSRRRGLARQLADPLIEALETEGRKAVITDAVDGASWEPKLAALGMKKALTDLTSRLIVADIDWDLMDVWESRARERAGEYELLYLTAPIPDEHLEKWCRLSDVMNSAPWEDLEIEETEMTPEKWCEIESKDMANGQNLNAHVAVHKPTGEWAGLSEIMVLDHQPDLARQGDTGVEPDHRNKGLGRWLKAATIRRVIADHPEIERIDTENAGSNKPMLNINYEMGYRPLIRKNAWQGDLTTIKERLGI